MNPYEANTPASSTTECRRRLLPVSAKRVAWDGILLLIAVLLLADNYSRFLPNLTRFFSRPNYDIYTVASFARLTGLFTPVFLLVAFSGLFFTKRSFSIRLPFLIPLFSILMHSVPPRNVDYALSVVYLLAVSSILLSGVGSPILARDFLRQYRVGSRSRSESGQPMDATEGGS